MMLARRPLLLASAATLAGLGGAGSAWGLPPKTLVFPRDHGSHPDFNTEWWYITGYAHSGRLLLGFQVTFFRSRVAATQGMRSRLAARQLIFAHVAVSDIDGQKLWHDQRMARSAGDAQLDTAWASTHDTAIRLGAWQLERLPTGYRADIQARDFALHLDLRPQQPLLLQGQQGLSRKGPQPEQASYYYSIPQLAVQGQLSLQGQTHGLHNGARGDPHARAAAWLDHEWSQALLHPQAVGWDWIGMNLLDGSALTVFRLRRADGSSLWAGGSWRVNATPTAPPRIFGADEVHWRPGRRWRSAGSGADYPVQWTLHTPVGEYTVRALLDAQEIDSRSSTGTVYWEGLSELLDTQQQRVGLGYLEMTGYAGRLQL